MENGKKSVKYRILAGFLALVLANSNISLAIGESKYNNKTVKAKIVKSVKDIDLNAYSNYFAEPDFSGDYDEKVTHVHAYVNDNGDFVKWLPCEKMSVDGLHWTNQKKYLTDDEIMASLSSDEWGIAELHANLYYNMIQKCVVPIYPEDVPEDDSWVKCFGIRFLSRDKCQILMETGLQRVVDNIDLIHIANNLMQFGSEKYNVQDTVNNLLLLKPILIDDKKMLCENMLIKEGNIDYASIIGMLIYKGVVSSADKNVNMYETDLRYVQVPRVPNFQKSIIVPPVK